MNLICSHEGHDWSPTGVYVNGALWAPCKRKGCEAGVRPGVCTEEHMFPSSVHGVPLDIEDDPQGGVAKIVMRELNDNQAINNLGLGPGSMAIDIGAHVGIVSIFLAIRYPGVIVYAYEPIQANFERLNRNLKANGVWGDDYDTITGVYANPIAVTGDGRNLPLFANLSDNSGGSSAFGGFSGSKEDVFSTTLEEIFELGEIDRCNLLKIDAEGAEYEILEAGEAYLDRVDWLMGEFHTNARLGAMGKDMNTLYQMCARHIPTDHIVVTPCRMGD